MTEPLTPAECDLRGYEYMPLYGDRLFKSETWIAASHEAKIAALRLWWHSYAHEVPAASLPNNDVLLADYAGYGVAVKAWTKIKAQVMRGFVLCSDGRWYHPIVAELAIEAFDERSTYKAARNGDRERLRQWRAAKEAKRLSKLAGNVPGNDDGNEDETRFETGSKRLREERNGEDRNGEVKQDQQLLPPDGGAAPEPAPKKPKYPECPHDEIVEAYHDLLPSLPKVKIWTKARQTALTARWRNRFDAGKFTESAQGVAVFRSFFKYVGKSPFLMGQVAPQAGQRPFLADLEWLVNDTNFTKVVEGKYHE